MGLVTFYQRLMLIPSDNLPSQRNTIYMFPSRSISAETKSHLMLCNSICE